jgi:DNA-binding transcriptional ArsR family regulator
MVIWPNTEPMAAKPRAVCRCSESLSASAEVFKALGHPTRVLVVEVIGDGERCVRELTDRAGCDMSTMSNHLAVLRSAGILRSERRRSQVFYRVAKPCVLDFLRCLQGAQGSV